MIKLKRLSSCPQLLMFLLLGVIYYWDNFLLGPYAIVPFGDIFDSAFLNNSVTHGQQLLTQGWFGWYASFAGGLPSMVNHQPPWALQSLIVQCLPLWLYYTLFQCLQFSLAGYGMFLFLVRFIKIARPIAFWGGIAYALSTSFGFMFIFFPLFPIVFVWALDLFDGGKSCWGRLFRIVAIFLVSLASFPVFTIPYFAVLHFFIILAFGLRENGVRRVCGTVLLWTGYVLIFLPFIYGLYEYVPFVSREWHYVYTDLATALISLWYGFTSVARATPVLIVFWVCLLCLRFEREQWVALLFVLIPTFIGAFFGSDFMAVLKDTFWVKMDLGHFVHLSRFGLVLFCSISLNQIALKKKRIPWVFVVLAIVVSAVVCNENQSLRNLALLGLAMPLVFFVRDGKAFEKRVVLIRCVMFVVGLTCSMMIVKQQWELTFTNIPYERAYGQKQDFAFLTSDTASFRVACLDLHPSIARHLGLETIGARLILTNKRYKKYFKTFMAPLLSDSEVADKFQKQKYVIYPMPLADYHNDNVNFDQLNYGIKRKASDWRIPMIAGLGVKYILSQTPVDGMEEWADIVSVTNGPGAPFDFLQGSDVDAFYSLPVWTYRLKEELGIARFARKTALFDSDEHILTAMGGADIAMMGDTVFLRDDCTRTDGLSRGAVDSFKRFADKMVITGHNSGSGYVLVMANWDPNWSASVDGQQVPIVRANHGFMAVYVRESGRFSIEFSYSNLPVAWLHVATAFGFVVMFLSAFVAPREGGGRNKTSETLPVCFLPSADGIVRWSVLGAGITMVVLWLVGFYAAIYLTHADDPLTPYRYMMMQIPIMGVLISGWTVWVMDKEV